MSARPRAGTSSSTGLRAVRSKESIPPLVASGYESSSADSASLSADYRPFADYRFGKATAASPAPRVRHVPSSSASGPRRGPSPIDRSVSPVDPAAPDSKRRRIRVDSLNAAPPGFPHRNATAYLLDRKAGRLSADSSSGDSSQEVDLDLSWDVADEAVGSPHIGIDMTAPQPSVSLAGSHHVPMRPRSHSAGDLMGLIGLRAPSPNQPPQPASWARRGSVDAVRTLSPSPNGSHHMAIGEDGSAGWRYMPTVSASARTGSDGEEALESDDSATPSLRRRRTGSGPLRIFLDRALRASGLPSPPWIGSPTSPAAHTRRGSRGTELEFSPSTATTTSPRTPGESYGSLSMPITYAHETTGSVRWDAVGEPRASHEEVIAPVKPESPRSAGFGFGGMFGLRQSRGRQPVGLGVHVPQLSVSAPADAPSSPSPRAGPIRPHSPGLSVGSSSPTPGSPLLGPSPAQPESTHIRFDASPPRAARPLIPPSPTLGHGKPTRSLFTAESTPSPDSKGKGVDRTPPTQQRPLRLVEAMHRREGSIRTVGSSDPVALADVSGSTAGVPTNSTQRSTSMPSILVRKTAATTLLEVSHWPGSRLLDDTASWAPPQPARLLFLAGFAMPALWLVGGWALRQDGEMIGARGAWCRCQGRAREASNGGHAAAVSLGIFDEDEDQAVAAEARKPLCDAERHRRLRLLGVPSTGLGLDHDSRFASPIAQYQLGADHGLDRYVLACRCAAVTSSFVLAALVAVALHAAIV